MVSNLRHDSLRLLLLVAVTAFSVTAGAASDTNERVAQLERVYGAHSQALTQLQQQVSANQSDIDTLRGQIQENQYQIQQIIERQKQILLQLDNLTQGNSAPASSVQGQSTKNNQDSSTANPIAKQQKPANEKSDYEAAVALIHDKARVNDAIAAFQAFSRQYPKSKLQPNAIYWLGQLNYSAGKKDDALYYFAKAAKDYPKSAKAAESLYKVGVVMEEKGDKEQAKAVYNQVIRQYPASSSAKQAEKRSKAL